MENVLKTLGVATVAVVVAGFVGGAGAQLPSTGGDGAKTITVNGVGYGGSVAGKSTLPSRTGAYAKALDEAMSDADTKAKAIAARASLTVIGVNEVAEQGSAADCVAPRTKTSCSIQAAVSVVYTVG
jgi:hypothetical protein